MIWTRLAPRPLEPDAGMSVRTVVTWEVANDDAFSQIVKQGRATAAPELGYSVHADVDGLEPGRWYFYRFHAGEAVSPVGRLRTMPAAGAQSPLKFSFISCQNYENGLYTAHEHMARESLDLVAFLGDYIYESGPGATGVRQHATLEPRDLSGYRARYAQYKSDGALKSAHALCPWLVIWDDHEVDNNYARDAGENDMESEEQMRARRAAACIKRGGRTSRCESRVHDRGRTSPSCAPLTGDRSFGSISSTADSIAATRPAATARTSCPAASGPIPSARCSATSRNDGSAQVSRRLRRAGRCSRIR